MLINNGEIGLLGLPEVGYRGSSFIGNPGGGAEFATNLGGNICSGGAPGSQPGLCF